MTTSLGDALEAFILAHEYCGELDGAVENDRIWIMKCSCGADDRLGRSMTNGRGRLRALVVAHHLVAPMLDQPLHWTLEEWRVAPGTDEPGCALSAL
jgi:hypothetical protein